MCTTYIQYENRLSDHIYPSHPLTHEFIQIHHSCKTFVAIMESPRQQLINRLTGQVYIIPDLYSLFPGWKPRVNEYYEASKKNCDNWVLQYVLLF